MTHYRTAATPVLSAGRYVRAPLAEYQLRSLEADVGTAETNDCQECQWSKVYVAHVPWLVRDLRDARNEIGMLRAENERLRAEIDGALRTFAAFEAKP